MAWELAAVLWSPGGLSAENHSMPDVVPSGGPTAENLALSGACAPGKSQQPLWPPASPGQACMFI